MILTLQGGTQARTLLHMLAKSAHTPPAAHQPATPGNTPAYAGKGSLPTDAGNAECSVSHEGNPIQTQNVSENAVSGSSHSAGPSVSHIPSVKAGFLPGTSYPDGTPVAAIAAVQEFGAVIRKPAAHGSTSHSIIPSRPFMRNAVAQDARKWKEVFRQAFMESLAANRQPDRLLQTLHAPTAALQQTGQAMQASLTHAIQALHTPPNAPATIRRKGSYKPLEDTKTLLHSVSFQVQV